MNSNNFHGHSHKPEENAVILPFPQQHDQLEHVSGISKFAKVGMAAALTVYSAGAVAYPAYQAYEELEGTDLLVGNVFAGSVVAGLTVVGLSKVINRFRRS